MTTTTMNRVGNAGAAQIAGITPATWRSYVSRGEAPPPDGREAISGTPWWRVSTIERWMRSRPGQGSRTDLVR
jgi:hypothetical protein